jgi:hypothetical protein
MVYFKEIPTDWNLAVQQVLALVKGSDRTIWIYDCKSFNDRLTLKNFPRSWRNTPPLDEGHFGQCMTAMFEKENIFRENDVLLTLDGRRSGTSDRMARILNRLLKKQQERFCKRPLGKPLRLFYSNVEFL